MRAKNGFIDWITITQFHPQGGLPLIHDGVIVSYDREGLPRYERASSRPHLGSFETSVRVCCDGFRVSLSGNVSRFSRTDNLYGFGFKETIARCNAILDFFGLPDFEADTRNEQNPALSRVGARVSRLDFTVNYSTGCESSARSVIRQISEIAVSRVKRGLTGDSSYWFANSHWMFKAYIKHIEMLAHGSKTDCPVYTFAKDNGILRIELELKKRLLSKLNMNSLNNLNDQVLEEVFKDQTKFLHKIERSFDDDLLDLIPPKSRVYAQSWLSGNDLHNSVSRSTLFRHARVLRDFGIDIMQKRNVTKLEPKVRFIDLKPCPVPDFYHDLPDELLNKAA